MRIGEISDVLSSGISKESNRIGNMKTSRLLLCAVALLATMGCSSSGNGDESTPTPEPTPEPVSRPACQYTIDGGRIPYAMPTLVAAGWMEPVKIDPGINTLNLYPNLAAYAAYFNAAWPAARRATGTRKGEQLT